MPPALWGEHDIETMRASLHDALVARGSAESEPSPVHRLNLVKSDMLRCAARQSFEGPTEPLNLCAPKLIEANKGAII
jgi:hypothetical protein